MEEHKFSLVLQVQKQCVSSVKDVIHMEHPPVSKTDENVY